MATTKGKMIMRSNDWKVFEEIQNILVSCASINAYISIFFPCHAQWITPFLFPNEDIFWPGKFCCTVLSVRYDEGYYSARWHDYYREAYTNKLGEYRHMRIHNVDVEGMITTLLTFKRLRTECWEAIKAFKQHLEETRTAVDLSNAGLDFELLIEKLFSLDKLGMTKIVNLEGPALKEFKEKIEFMAPDIQIQLIDVEFYCTFPDPRKPRVELQGFFDTVTDCVDNLSYSMRETAMPFQEMLGDINKKGIDLNIDPELKGLLSSLDKTLKQALNGIQIKASHSVSLDVGNLANMIKTIPSLIILMFVGGIALYTRDKKWITAATILAGGCGVVLFTSLPESIMKFFSGVFLGSTKAQGESEPCEFQAAEPFEHFIGKMGFLGLSALLFKRKRPMDGVESFLRSMGSFERSSEGLGSVFSFILDAIEKALNWLMKMFGHEEKVELVHKAKDDLSLWIKKVTEVYDRHVEGDLKITRNNYEAILRLRYEGQSFLNPNSVFSGDSNMRQITSYYLRMLNELEQPFRAANIGSYGARFEPVCIFVHGKSGVGKSWATLPMLIEVIGSVLEDEQLEAFELNHMDFIYARQAEHKFWDGYRGQFATVFDDFGQIRDQAGVADNEFMDLIRTGNLFPNVLHMASLEAKGNTYFCSKVIMCTSNRSDLESNIQSIIEPQAVTRRFDINVRAVPKPEFCLDPEAPVDGRVLDRTKLGHLDPGTFNSDIYLFIEKDTNKEYTYSELVDRVIAIYRSRETKFGNFSNSVADLKKRIINNRRKKPEFQAGEDDLGPLRPDNFARAHVHAQRTLRGKPADEHVEYREFFRKRLRDKTHASNPFDKVRFSTSMRKFLPEEELEAFNFNDERIKQSPGWLDLDTPEGMFSYGASDYDPPKQDGPYSELFLEKVRDAIRSPKNDSPLLPQQLEMWQEHLFRTYKRLPHGEQLGSMRWLAAILYVAYGEDMDPTHSSIKSAIINVVDNRDLLYKARILNCTTTSYSIRFDETYTNGALGYIERLWDWFKAKWDSWCEPILVFSMVFAAWNIGAAIGKFAWNWYKGDDKDFSTAEKVEKVKTVKKDAANLQSGDSNTNEVMDKILNRNAYTLWLGHRLLGGVIAYRETYVIMPCHFKDIILRDKKNKVDNGIKPAELTMRSLTGKMEFTLCYSDFEDRVESEQNYDFCIVKLDQPNFFPDVSHLFVTEEDVKKNPDLNLQVTVPRSIVAGKRPGEINVYCAKGQFTEDVNAVGKDGIEVRLMRPISYDVPTKKGDCGFPIFLVNPAVSRKVLGFHVAGTNDNVGMGMCLTSSFVAERYQKLKKRLDEGGSIMETTNTPSKEGVRVVELQDGQSGLVFHGKSGFKFTQPLKSKIKKSRVYGAWGPALKTPAVLAPRDTPEGRVDPLRAAVMRYSDPPPKIEVDYLPMVGDFLLQRLRRQSMAHVCKDILTFDEAVLGVPHDKYMSAIPRGTSAGFPLSVMPIPGYPGKTYYFGTDVNFDLTRAECEQLRSEVYEIIEDAKKGVRRQHLYTDICKDELRSHEKVASIKTRLISGCPFAYLLAFRMYFLPFSSWIMKNHVVNHCAVGVNPYSDGWDALYRRLRAKSEVGLDADISGFDTSECRPFFEIILWIIDQWFDDGYTVIRRVLFEEVWNSWHLMGDELVEWLKGLPSGHPFTTIINCIYLLLVILCTWVEAHNGDITSLNTFFDHVFPVVYGDDSIMALDIYAQDKFNLDVLVDMGKKFGINFTSGSKHEHYKFKPLTELTFLKRKFRYEPAVGRYVAPLDLATVLEMPYWYSKGPSPEGRQIENLNNALMELSMHGEEVWDQWYPKIYSAAKKALNYEPPFTMWFVWLKIALNCKNEW